MFPRWQLATGLIASSFVFGALFMTSAASPLQQQTDTTEAQAETTSQLGTASNFSVLAGTTVTNTGATTVRGSLGVSPGTAVTGFPPGAVTGGSIHSADAAAAQAEVDTTAAYNGLVAQPCTADLTGQDLGGKTLTPGVYCFSSSAQLTGTLTLNAQGNTRALFIFKMGSTLTTASAASVIMINGGSPCNVFWQIGSSATLGTTTSFAGNIVALTSITLTTGVKVSGRALARNGAVTMDTNVVDSIVCGAITPPPTPTALPKTSTPVARPTSTPVPNCDDLASQLEAAKARIAELEAQLATASG